MITGFPSNYTSTDIPVAGPVRHHIRQQRLRHFAVYSTSRIWRWRRLLDGSRFGQYGDCVNVQITQARNATGLETIKGMELNWVQPLDFLLKDYGLEGFGWVANATMISTKTTKAAPLRRWCSTCRRCSTT